MTLTNLHSIYDAREKTGVGIDKMNQIYAKRGGGSNTDTCLGYCLPEHTKQVLLELEAEPKTGISYRGFYAVSAETPAFGG